MQIVFTGLILVGLIPLARALWVNRGTSLTHALVWTIAAWLSWGVAFLLSNPEQASMEPARYCTLGLTGCAGVAVLGARRPHVFAWDFVVLGLLAVMLLPLIEAQFIGTQSMAGLRVFFLAATIAVGLINYLPTRLAPVALLLSVVSAGQIVLAFMPTWLPGFGEMRFLDGMLTAVPWIGWICVCARGEHRSAVDRLWLDFRDRWGLVWSQRVREQFNHAAENAGWPARLTWRGLTAVGENEEKYLETLRAILQRFISRAGSVSDGLA